MPDRRLEALLRLLHQSLLEPVLAAVRVGEQHDLVGLEGLERILYRQQGIGFAGVAGGVDPLLLEPLDGLLLHLLGALDPWIGVGEYEAPLRLERRRHDENLGALAVLLADQALERVDLDRLGHDSEDLLAHGWGLYPIQRP